MALPQYPKFCNIHQVIHICENMDPMFKVKAEEAKLASKVRRLHGKQTEEELEAERQKSAPQKGSLAAILASAKENIKKEKSKLKGSNSDIDADGEGKIDEGSLSDRMKALRAKTLGESAPQVTIPSSNDDYNPPIERSNPPIERSNPPTGNISVKPDTITNDYLNDIKDRHESMYSAVRMSELKNKRPTAAIHLPKKRTSSTVLKPKVEEKPVAVKKSEPKVVIPKAISKTAKKSEAVKAEKATSTTKKVTTPSTTAKIKAETVKSPTKASTTSKNAPAPKTTAVKPKTESKSDKPVFTKAETKKLIEEAVKLALKKVGKIE